MTAIDVLKKHLKEAQENVDRVQDETEDDIRRGRVAQQRLAAAQAEFRDLATAIGVLEEREKEQQVERMTVEQEAREAAEKRYARRGEVTLSPSAVRNARREAFEKGYIAGATRPVTDAEVEAGCAGFYNDPVNGLTSWRRLAEVDPKLADKYRAGMRAALEAAREETNRGIQG